MMNQMGFGGKSQMQGKADGYRGNRAGGGGGRAAMIRSMAGAGNSFLPPQPPFVWPPPEPGPAPMPIPPPMPGMELPGGAPMAPMPPMPTGPMGPLGPKAAPGMPYPIPPHMGGY